MRNRHDDNARVADKCNAMVYNMMTVPLGMRTQSPSAKSEETEVAVTGAYSEHTSVRRPRLTRKGREGERVYASQLRSGANTKYDGNGRTGRRKEMKGR